MPVAVRNYFDMVKIAIANNKTQSKTMATLQNVYFGLEISKDFALFTYFYKITNVFS